MDYQTIILQVATIIAAIAGGTAVVPVVNWLKAKLNLEGWSALALTAVVSLVIAVAELIATGELDITNINAGNLSATFLLVLYASQKVYERLNQ